MQRQVDTDEEWEEEWLDVPWWEGKKEGTGEKEETEKEQEWPWEEWLDVPWWEEEEEQAGGEAEWPWEEWVHEPEWEEEEEEESFVQPKLAAGQAPQVGPSLAAQIRSLKGGGRPLSQAERDFFEPRFGHEFSQVRVHTDAKAAKSAQMIGAQAYTVGRDLVFGAEQYTPESDKGMRLLAHELTHVLQQDSEQCMGKTIRRQSRGGTAVRGLPTVRVGGVTYVTTDPGELVKADDPDIKRIDPRKTTQYQRFRRDFVSFLVGTRPMRTSSIREYRNRGRALKFYGVFIEALEKANLPVTLWPYLITAMERENPMGLQHVTQNVFNVNVVKFTKEIDVAFSRIKHPGMKRWLTRAGIDLTTVARFKRDMRKLGQLVSTNKPAKIAKAALLLLAYTSRQLYSAFASTRARRKEFSTKVRGLKPIERAVMVFFAATGLKTPSGKEVSGIEQARRLLRGRPVAAIGKLEAEEKRWVQGKLRGQYAQFKSRYEQIRQKLIQQGRAF